MSQYRYRSWNQDSGLMVDAVNFVTVSEDGKVWLGTSQGIGLFYNFLAMQSLEVGSLIKPGQVRCKFRPYFLIIPANY